MGVMLSREVLLEPYYEVHINGKKLGDSLKKFITNVEVELSDSEAHLGRVSVADVDFKFSQSLNLDDAVPIKIYMGHRKHFRCLLDGEITHAEAEFGDDGIPKITIGAIDKTNKLTHVKKSRVFKSTTVSNVVRTIAKEYGFKAKVQDTTTVIDQITQDDETDAQLLKKLAEDEAFKFYIIRETNELYFGDKIKDPKVIGELNYNSGNKAIINFSPSLVIKNKADKTSSKSSNISDTTGTAVTKNSSVDAGAPPKKTQAITVKKVGIMTATGKIVENI